MKKRESKNLMLSVESSVWRERLSSLTFLTSHKFARFVLCLKGGDAQKIFPPHPPRPTRGKTSCEKLVWMQICLHYANEKLRFSSKIGQVFAGWSQFAPFSCSSFFSFQLLQSQMHSTLRQLTYDLLFLHATQTGDETVPHKRRKSSGEK